MCTDLQGFPWISKNLKGSVEISKDLHGFGRFCKGSSRFAGISKDLQGFIGVYMFLEFFPSRFLVGCPF